MYILQEGCMKLQLDRALEAVQPLTTCPCVSKTYRESLFDAYKALENPSIIGVAKYLGFG